MRAALDNLAIAHYQDAIGVANRRQTVCHDKARATSHELVECRLHLQLGTRIDARRCLVQQQNRRIGEHDARDAQQLFLTLAKRAAVLADHRIVAAWQLHDKLMRMSALGGLDNLLAHGIGTTVGNVLGYRALEQPGVLQHHAKGAAQARTRVVTRGATIDRDAPGIDIVKAQQQVDERRLATARGTDEGKARTGLGIDADILQQFAVGHIAKVHMLKRNLALRGGELNGIHSVGFLLARIEQREHAARRGVRGLNLRNDVGDLVERLGVLVGIGQENLHAAHRKRRGHARDHAHAANHSDHSVDDVVDKARTGVRERTHKLRALTCRIELGVEDIEALLSVRAIGEGIHELLLTHILLDMTAKLALNSLLCRKAFVGKLGDGAGCKNGKRRDKHHHERHGQVNGEHKRERAHDGDDAGKELRKALQQAVTHLIDVVDHAAHEVAVGMAVDKAERHTAELVARLNAHVAHRLVGQTVDAVALQPLEGRRAHHDNRELGNERQQHVKVHLPGGNDEVDALANEDGRIELQDHRDSGAHKRRRKRNAMRADVAQQAASYRAHGVALGVAGLTRAVTQVVEVIVAGHVGRHRGDRTGRSIRIHLAALLCASGCRGSRGGRGTWDGRGRRAPLLTLELLATKLRLANLAIELAACVQLVVRTQARDRAVVEHADHVGIAHGRDALAHDHRRERQPARGGTAYAALANGMAKRRVGLKVERRGGIIHNQDPRRAHQGTRNGQALALATAEVLTARLDRGVEPLRLVAHELAGLRHFERRPQFLIGCRLVAPG